MDQTSFYLTLSALVFSIGTLGVLVRRNTIIILMSIELMLNGVNISLVASANQFGAVEGQIYVFFIMAVAAAEAAVGLAIVIGVFRNFHSISESDIETLKG